MPERVERFVRALARLREVVPVPDDAVVRDAAIQRFEFTFELAWKAIQEVVRDTHGLPAASPRLALQAAWSVGLVPDETVWLAMLKDRNLSSHTYDEALARELAARLPAHLAAFEALARSLATRA